MKKIKILDKEFKIRWCKTLKENFVIYENGGSGNFNAFYEHLSDLGEDLLLREFHSKYFKKSSSKSFYDSLTS